MTPANLPIRSCALFGWRPNSNFRRGPCNNSSLSTPYVIQKAIACEPFIAERGHCKVLYRLIRHFCWHIYVSKNRRECNIYFPNGFHLQTKVTKQTKWKCVSTPCIFGSGRDVSIDSTSPESPLWVPLEDEGWSGTFFELFGPRELTFRNIAEPEVASARIVWSCWVPMLSVLPVASTVQEVMVNVLTSDAEEDPLLTGVVTAATWVEELAVVPCLNEGRAAGR